MASLLRSIANSLGIGWKSGELLLGRCLRTSAVNCASGKKGLKSKKKQHLKQSKTKKELRREMMKEYMKRTEMEKLTQHIAMKAAKKGEPLDPEMLNPARKRPPLSVSEEEKERRFLLVKEWSRDRMEKHKRDLQFLQGVLRSREKALRELRKVSPRLYLQALELNPKLFPFERQGPTATLPIPSYQPPELES